MGIGMADTANTVFRDFATDGVPSSGKNRPRKPDIRRLLTGYEAIINAFLSNGGLIYPSKAALDADLARGANSMAWVMGDATTANNGIYRKVGASGSGSWTRVADLPISFIPASDVGAGTANAIQATSPIPVSGSALIWMNIFEANTSSPVTVSFNGAAALTIKTNSGQNVAAGGLVSGMIVLGIVSGSTFRLVSDQASAAILAAAEAAVAEAETLVGQAATALQPEDIGVDVAAYNDRRIAQVIVADDTGLYPGDGLAQRRLIITGDDIDADAHGIIARGYRLAHTFGGATMTGARIAAEFSAIHEAPDNPSNAVADGVALTASYYGTSAGGWGGSSGSPRGNAFAFNAIVTTFSGYTHIDNVTGAEINTQMETGSSARYKSGAQIVSRDQVHATGPDVGLAVSAITGAVGYKHAISFGDMNGDPPVGSTGTLIGSYTLDGVSLHPAAVGIDLTAWAFSDSVMKTGGYVIKAGGSVVAGATTAAQVQYDYKTSGLGSAYDARIAVSGGTATDGEGNMTIVAGHLNLPNKPGAPDASGYFTIAADTSNAYLRFKFGTSIYRSTLPLTLEP